MGLVVMPNKLWAMKNMQGKRYGLALKITHLEVEPVSRSSLREYVEGDAFLDSDDEEEPVQATTSKLSKATLSDDDSDDDDDDDSQVLNTKSLGADLDDDDDDDDEDDSDSDSEDEPVVKKKATKKASKKTS